MRLPLASFRKRHVTSRHADDGVMTTKGVSQAAGRRRCCFRSVDCGAAAVSAQSATDEMGSPDAVSIVYRPPALNTK